MNESNAMRTETNTPNDPANGTNEPDSACDASSETMPGIVAELGTLPPGAVVNLPALAKLFGRHPFSVKRAIERGELPRPARLFGQDCWTAGAIVRHFEARLDHAAKEAERIARTIQQHKP